MPQNRGLTPEEIEAMDQDIGTPGQKLDATPDEIASATDRYRTATQEPEARS